MLPEKSINDLASLAGIEAKVLNDAITAEETQEIELSKTNSFTNDELDMLKENVKKENQGDYENAKTVGREKTLKEMCDEIGMDRTKDPKEFIINYKAHVLKDSGEEPNKLIEELKGDNQILRNQLEEKDSLLNTEKLTYESQLFDISINNKLSSMTNGELGALSESDYVSLYRRDHQIVNEDGKNVLKLNGETLKDNLQNPIDPYKHYQEWIVKKGVVEKQTGRGGGNSEGSFSEFSSIKNREDLNKHFEEKGITDFNEKQEILNKVMENESYQH